MEISMNAAPGVSMNTTPEDAAPAQRKKMPHEDVHADFLHAAVDRQRKQQAVHDKRNATAPDPEEFKYARAISRPLGQRIGDKLPDGSLYGHPKKEVQGNDAGNQQ